MLIAGCADMMREASLFNIVFAFLFLSSFVSAQSASASHSLSPTTSTSSASQTLSPSSAQLQSTVASTKPTSTTLDPTSTGLPSCALNCQTFTKAESQCESSNPGGVLQTNQTQYQQCFCTSSLMTPLLSSSNDICDTECPSQDDRNKIRVWYMGFCSAYTSSTSPTSTPATSATSTGTESKTQTSVAQSTAKSDNPSTPSRPSISKGKTIGIAVGAVVGLVLLCMLAYYPVFSAGRRAMRSRTPSPSLTDEEEGGAPIAEIQRSPQGRSRRGSVEIEKGMGFGGALGKSRSRRSSIGDRDVDKRMPMPGQRQTVHVISVAAFKE